MGDSRDGVTDFEDYYDLLGVDPDADEAAILRAYRQAVKEYHPDRREAATLDTDTAAAVFKHLSTARSILTVHARRAEYDRLGHRTYLLRHDGDEEAVSPGASDHDPEETTTEDGRGAWYAATTPAPERVTEEPAATGVAAGSVVEGSDLGVADLLGSGPLETAWRRFLAVWLLRTLALGGGVAAAVTLTSPAVAAGVVLAVVALSGLVAVVSTPVAADPVTPPASASVGLLAPAAADRWLRVGRRSLALACLLVAVVVLTAPRPVATLGPVVPLEWVPEGALGAPKLRTLVSDGLTALFCGCLAVGVAGTVGGASARAWLARHGGHRRRRPWLVDCLAVSGTLSVVLGVAVAPATPTLAPDLGVWSAGVYWVFAGVVGLLALSVASDHSAVRTSAATA